MPEKVIVGISGGVDSSVAALLLKDRGYRVEALFMKNWDDSADGEPCPWESDVEDAMAVCDRLGIPLNTIDLSREYWDGVFERFLAEYRRGRTPNPDVLCNQEIKFKAFLDHAVNAGASLIATGHYARISRAGNRLLLRKAADAGKDQSYFLCRLTQAQLQRTLFPIGDLDKTEVRKIAREAGLPNHDKKDSTGICFIGERPFRDFLARYLPAQPGEIRTTEGRVIGRHDGTHFYTVGQRQGLGIGGVPEAGDQPWYVVGRDIEQNVLTVAQGHDHPLLFSQKLTAVNPHWIDGNAPVRARLGARIRYRQPDQDCTLETLDGDNLSVSFAGPQWAVAPGQYIVFYDGDACCGGAVIESARN